MTETLAMDNGGGARRLRIIGQRAALLALLIGLWWVVSLASPPYILPRPDRVLQRIVELLQSGDLVFNILTTLGRVVAGFAIAVVLGVPLGILLGSNRAVGEFF